MTQESIRNRQLTLFLCVGAPALLWSIKTSSVSFKDIGSTNIILNSSTDSSIINNSYTMSSLLLFLKNKIPNWFKLIFILLIISITVLKLMGFPILYNLFNKIDYLKWFSVVLCLLAILHNIISLYLIQKYSNKSISIPEVLPDFLIKWLSEFKYMGKSSESIKDYKDIYYRGIIVYILIIIFIIIISMI
jgi:hypothetical protein